MAAHLGLRHRRLSRRDVEQTPHRNRCKCWCPNASAMTRTSGSQRTADPNCKPRIPPAVGKPSFWKGPLAGQGAGPCQRGAGRAGPWAHAWGCLTTAGPTPRRGDRGTETGRTGSSSVPEPLPLLHSALPVSRQGCARRNGRNACAPGEVAPRRVSQNEILMQDTQSRGDAGG